MDVSQDELRATDRRLCPLTAGADTQTCRLIVLTGGAADEVPPSLAGMGGRTEGCIDGPLTGHRRLLDAFWSAACRYADRPAVVTGRRSVTYAQLGAESLCIAEQLLAEPRYWPGDRVAVMLENGPEFVAAYYGILAAGGVVVPLPATVEWERWQRIAGLCDVKVVITTAAILARRGQAEWGNAVSLDLGGAHRARLPQAEPLRIGGESLAMIMFTSGSSGEPKGVMLSDRNLLANTQSIRRYLKIGSDERALALLPFYHAFGHSVLQTHLLSGATLVVDGNMAFPNSVVDALDRHQATSFSAVPEGYYALLTLSDLRDRALPHLRYMSVAGGALKPEAVVQMVQCIAPADFYVMYGQTEASARLAFLPPHLARVHPDAIGVAIPGVELRVLNAAGQEAAEGETGELCARGANVMLGYWNDPEATARVMRDGWLRTGDLGARDAHGLIYVKARQNDLVKVQGFRLHPKEIEDVVGPHFPEVRIVVVPYQQHDITRLALFAITPRVDAELVGQIRSTCQRMLPRHKVPSHFEVLAQAPLNASMKLDRAGLVRRAQLHAGLAEVGNTGCGPLRKRSA